ncbi:MAG: hypothetical protein IT435_16235 [Phycisphaerales bacterium]|nr:hypothetical protein [Phycisphaerales bacterium]
MAHRELAVAVLASAIALPGITCAQPSAPTPIDESVRLEFDHCQFNLPPGWNRAAQDQVDDFNSMMKRQIGDNAAMVEWIAAAARGQPVLTELPTGLTSFARPYLVVQRMRMPMANLSFDDIERGFNAATMQKAAGEVAESSEGMLRAVEMGKAILDREHSRITTRIELNVAGERVIAVAATFLSLDGNIQLNFYTDADTFEAELPGLEASIKSFAFDDGYRFRPVGSGAGASPSGTFAFTDTMSRIAGVALVLALAVVVVKYARFKPRVKPERGNPEG